MELFETHASAGNSFRVGEKWNQLMKRAELNGLLESSFLSLHESKQKLINVQTWCTINLAGY